MNELRDIMTYSRYYPTVSFQIVGGISMPMIEGNIINRIHTLLPEAKITKYQSFLPGGALKGRMSRLQNIIIVPSDSIRVKNEDDKFEICKYDILAYRIQIIGDRVKLSCWFSASNTDNLYIHFNTDGLYDLWENTCLKLVQTSEDNINFRCTWLNYLRAVDALACVLPTFMRVFGLEDMPTLSLSEEPLRRFFSEDTADSVSMNALSSHLISIVLTPCEHNSIASCPDASYHTQAVSKYPSVPDDYQGLNSRIPQTAISTDEALALMFTNMRMCFFGARMLSAENIHYGDNYSSIRLLFPYSRIPESEIDIELIASLWKGIDDKSIICAYETTKWESENHHTLFFRCSHRLTSHMRFAALTLAIIDNWRTLFFETSISRTNLDQLLAILTLPESAFCDKTIRAEVDYLDMPNYDVTTLLSAGMGRFISALNFVLRTKIIEQSEGRSGFLQSADTPVTRLLRQTASYKIIRYNIASVMKIYHNWSDSAYCPLINNIFLSDADRQQIYLHTWTKKAKAYFINQNEKLERELVDEIERIILHTTYLREQDIQDYLNLIELQNNNDRQVIRCHKLLEMLPSQAHFDVNTIARRKSDYLDLYINLYRDDNYEDAKQIYDGLNRDLEHKDAIDILFSDEQTMNSQTGLFIKSEARKLIVEQITSSTGL